MKGILTSIVLGAALWVAPFVCAAPPDEAQAADIVILGELHNNAAHHMVQAEWITALSPTAVVFEMLTPDEAASLAEVPRTAAEMGGVVDGFHWSNIEDYVPVLAASEVIIGAAASRQVIRDAFGRGAAAVFGDGADLYGLTAPLAPDVLEARMQHQFSAHCEAMPLEMMQGMVEAQRLRDAIFARTVLQAIEAYGGPVVLIAGNGHARRDWGVPSMLPKDLRVFVLGQSAAGQIDGEFDLVLDAAPVQRGDPCAAFK